MASALGTDICIATRVSRGDRRGAVHSNFKFKLHCCVTVLLPYSQSVLLAAIMITLVKKLKYWRIM